MLVKIISEINDVIATSVSWFTAVNTLKIPAIKKIIPALRIHWYCFVKKERIDIIDVPRKKAVKSLTWVFLASPSI